MNWNYLFTTILATLITRSIGHRQVFLFSHLTYFMHLPYLGKLSRPKYQYKIKQHHENFTEDVFPIKKFYLSKQYGTRRLLSKLPDKGLELGSIDSLLKRIHKTGVWQPVSGRPRSARSTGGPCAPSGVQATKAPISS